MTTMHNEDPAASEQAPADLSDEYAGATPERVDAGTIRRLSELNPLISSVHIALEWALIVGVAISCWTFWHPVLYVVAIPFIGARQHALLVLAHDAAHYRLFRNRQLNDWVGEVLLAWPFVLLTMQAYRRNHFPHHRYVNTDRDPDWVRKQTPEWVFPKRPAALAWLLLQDVVGIGFLKFIIVASKLPKAASGANDNRQRTFAISRLFFLAGLAGIITMTGLWLPYLLFWVIPYVTWMQFCFHVRSIAEHFAIRGGSGVYAQTRTVLATWFDHVFIVPKNVNYHLEHHFYPSVPFYRLPELHQVLMQRPSFRISAQLTSSYFGVLRECTLER